MPIARSAPMIRLSCQRNAAHPKSTSPLTSAGTRGEWGLRQTDSIFPRPTMTRIATSRINSPLRTSAELNSRRFPASSASREGRRAVASVRGVEANVAYASTRLSDLGGVPSAASDHRPAAIGAASASTPNTINTARAIRFLEAPEGCGIGHPLAGMIILYQESYSWKEGIDVA